MTTITKAMMYDVSEPPSTPTLTLGEPTTTAVDHREREVQIDIDTPARRRRVRAFKGDVGFLTRKPMEQRGGNPKAGGQRSRAAWFCS